MDGKSESFWYAQDSENLKKLQAATENVKHANRDLWKSMITLHASFLGISISLMTYLKSAPNLLLTGTWVCQILAIGLGFFIFRLDIDREFKHSFDSFQFSMDTNDINIREAKGEFFGKEDERSGLLVSSLMKFEKSASAKIGQYWTDYAKKLFEKYESKLKSSQLFKEIKISKINEFKKNMQSFLPKLESIFYLLTIGAFILLLIGVLSNNLLKKSTVNVISNSRDIILN